MQDSRRFTMETIGVARRPPDVARSKSKQSSYCVLHSGWTERALNRISRKNTTMLVALELLITFLPVILISFENTTIKMG